VSNFKEISCIKSFLKENSNVEFSLKFEKDGSLRSQRKLQHLFCKRFSDKKTQKLFEIILDFAEKSERSCPGAGSEMIKIFSGISLELSLKKDVPKTKKDLEKEIDRLNLTLKSSSLLKEVLTLCHAHTRIKLKKSINDKTFIESSNSYHFNVESLVKQKRSHIKSLKAVCIDGFVEDVSELHHLFQHFSTNETGRPLAIFCRGMSDDVLNTISVNNNRESLTCFPFKVQFDVENVNTLVDIAVVAGCDVVSCLKGELISSINVSNLRDIDSMLIINDGILLKNSRTTDVVRSHIDRLKKKAEDSREESKEFIFKRIKSLSANSIDIAIPDDINFYSFSQEIDEGIRLITAAMSKRIDAEKHAKEFSVKLEAVINNIGEIL